MPNHCYQTVDIKGDAELVTELYYALTEQDRFCDFILPMPIEMREGDGWYDWRKENWGTKWDLCRVEIIETDNIQRDYFPKKGKLAGFSFKCWTAWREPTPVWEKLREMNVCVTAYYADEGGYFCGIYEDGDITESQEFDSEIGKIVIKNCGLEMEEA